ncbi:TatD family hydrolase [Patescibacteria group bacterium]|nr:TatD family hydrolase [Patescibacteria group bacterium]
MLVDTHAHISGPVTGVDKVINVGTSLEDSEKAIELAKKYDNIFAAVGIHPVDNPTLTINSIDWLKFEELAKQPKVVAIGECGLDYHQNQDKDRQRAIFSKQIEIAAKLNLPLSIHIRDARADLMERFGEILSGNQGVFHCFSGDTNYLNFILEKLPTFYISFAGNLTFRNAKELQELAKIVPFEKILIETDSPYLAPEPYRGSQNSPANVKIVASKLAELKGVSLEEIETITATNAAFLFGI